MKVKGMWNWGLDELPLETEPEVILEGIVTKEVSHQGEGRQ